MLPCEAYCLSGDEWHLPEQTGLFPPQGALHHAICRSERMVLVGGIDDNGLQRRGLGRPTDVHILDLRTWCWERLARHDLTPPLHTRTAALVLGNRLFIIGGDGGGAEAQSGRVVALRLDGLDTPVGHCGRQARWVECAALGTPFAAAGHVALGGMLLGGLGRKDPAAPAALLVPDTAAPAVSARQPRAPRWFKR